jgi:hypothetical protein
MTEDSPARNEGGVGIFGLSRAVPGRLPTSKSETQHDFTISTFTVGNLD